MCVPYLQRYGLLKMDFQLERVVEVRSFSQTNIKYDPLSLLWTLTQSLHFHTWNSWICFVSKNIKSFAEIENLDLLRIFLLPIPLKAHIFPPCRQSYQLVRNVDGKTTNLRLSWWSWPSLNRPLMVRITGAELHKRYRTSGRPTLSLRSLPY